MLVKRIDAFRFLFQELARNHSSRSGTICVRSRFGKCRPEDRNTADWIWGIWQSLKVSSLYGTISAFSQNGYVLLPENLVKQSQHFIKEGWATNFNDLIAVALQRYLEIYNTEFMEQEWSQSISDTFKYPCWPWERAGWKKRKEKTRGEHQERAFYHFSIYPEAFLFIASLGLNRILFPPEML